eukprot:PhM_4_TR5176/c1_g1_i1/m.27061
MLATKKGPVSMGKIKERAMALGAPASETAVITASELRNLKKLIHGDFEEEERRARNLEQKRRVEERAAERKRAMIALDEERRSKGVQQPMEEIEKEMSRKHERSRAQHKLDEEIDEVKHMNKLVLYSKCVTVRDAQLSEKDEIKAEQQEEARRLDMMMEVERLKALKMYEEREIKRIEDRKKGAAVIRAQIEEREQERLRTMELKQQEQDAMLRHINRMKDDDRVEAHKKKEAARRLMEDVALANAEQIRLKNRQREMEQEEDRRISEYIKEKEKREQEIQEEQERLRAEKEREIARLRSMQEKAQDKQAELDALRARRAQEAYEREWRVKEAETLHRQQAINEDLAQARERQKLEKELMLSEQARIEHEEFERIIAVQKYDDAVERERRGKDGSKRKVHADDLKKQIDEIEEARKNQRREFLQEGIRLRAQRKEEEEKIERIREKKLGELEQQAVPTKYRTELLKKRTMEPLRPAK